MFVMLGANQHEMSRGPANFGARHHELEVLLFGVLAAHFQAVPHRVRQADTVAIQALIDATFQLWVHVMHAGFSVDP